ncbi:hypothetical protein J6590_013639 [Homalodisca vitripennis]|nr:hypothetical protein J6590_013639 [Homalodisca vitripennis]
MPRSNRLDRAVSMDSDNRRYFNDIKTRPSSLMGRWMSFRNSLSNQDRLPVRDSPPASDDEEMGFLETEDKDVPTHDELSSKICKDTIRQTILDNMRLVSRDVKILLDIESTQLVNNDLEDILKNSEMIQRNIVFLWCAFLKKFDLLVAVEQLGVDVHFFILGGLTAVHLSAFSGSVKCLRWLIQKGCDINLMSESYTPLHCAVLGNSVETTKLLLREGAELKDSVLHSAVRVNAADCLTLLLKQNVNVNSLDCSGMAPLHIAADRRMEQCLKVLLDCTKIDIDLETKDKRNTALHLASEGGYADCVSMLLAKKATVDKRNVKLQTPLHLAAKCQGVECVEALLKAGSDVNAVDEDNSTPLRAAVGKDLLALNTVEILIASGAEVNVKDKYGFTALHVAALNELSQCVDALIMKGADVCAKTNGGLTCLSIIRRKTPACIATISKKLDSSISLHVPEASNREVEVKLDFRYLLQHSSIVHDIQGLHKTAGLLKIVRQTELISFLELALYQGYVPRQIMNVLNLTALVSPSAYRVVLLVKPLNPRENRLPKNILMEALKIARQRRRFNNKAVNYRYREPAKEDSTMQLLEEVRSMKLLLSEQQQSLAELIKGTCSGRLTRAAPIPYVELSGSYRQRTQIVLQYEQADFVVITCLTSTEGLVTDNVTLLEKYQLGQHNWTQLCSTQLLCLSCRGGQISDGPGNPAQSESILEHTSALSRQATFALTVRGESDLPVSEEECDTLSMAVPLYLGFLCEKLRSSERAVETVITEPVKVAFVINQFLEKVHVDIDPVGLSGRNQSRIQVGSVWELFYTESQIASNVHSFFNNSNHVFE